MATKAEVACVHCWATSSACFWYIFNWKTLYFDSRQKVNSKKFFISQIQMVRELKKFGLVTLQPARKNVNYTLVLIWATSLDLFFSPSGVTWFLFLSHQFLFLKKSFNSNLQTKSRHSDIWMFYNDCIELNQRLLESWWALYIQQYWSFSL